MSEDLDLKIRELVATCPCDACERYRVYLRAEAKRVTTLLQASLLGLRVAK